MSSRPTRKTAPHATAGQEVPTPPPVKEVKTQEEVDADLYMNTHETVFFECIRRLIGQGLDSSLAKALRHTGILTFTDLIHHGSDRLESIYYVEQGNQVYPVLGLVMKLSTLRDWIIEIRERYGRGRLLIADYQALDPEEFLDYLELSKIRKVNAPYPTSSSSPSASAKLDDANKLVENFKKSIKRDPSVFPKLRDNSHFQTFDQQFRIQAAAQDIEQITDPNYIPPDPEAKALFHEKQKYAFSILANVVMTDKGKDFVRAFLPTMDAQALYDKIRRDATESTAARLSATDLQNALYAMKLDSTYRGTAVGFLIYWKTCMSRLHDILPHTEHFNEGLKKRLLKHAVQPLPELAKVEMLEQNDIARGHSELTYESYFNLVMSNAEQHDYRLSGKGKRGGVTSRQVQYTELNHHEFLALYEDDDHDSALEKNTHVEVNKTHVRPPVKDQSRVQRIRFPPELWSTLPEEHKAFLKDQNNNSTKSYSAHYHDFVDDFKTLCNTDITPDPPQNTDMEVWHDAVDNKDGDVQHEPTTILAHITSQSRLPPGDIRRTLGMKSKTPSASDAKPRSAAPSTSSSNTVHRSVKQTIVVDGVTYQACVSRFIFHSPSSECDNSTTTTYHVSKHDHSDQDTALVDRGANGILGGSNVILLESTDRVAHVTGIAGATIENVTIGTVAGKVLTTQGPAIFILHQAAYRGKGSTILSSGQLESFQLKVDDRSLRVGGTQTITTPDGYVLPIRINNGLPYIHMEKPTMDEVDTLPHIIGTSDEFWDPSELDGEHDHHAPWADALQHPNGNPYEAHVFDDTGEYLQRTIANSIRQNQSDIHDDGMYFFDAYQHTWEAVEPTSVIDAFDIRAERTIEIHERNFAPQPIDYESLRPNFAWFPTNIIKDTFAVTTQYGRNSYRLPFRKHFRSRFPALNVHRRNEAVATDTVFSDVPAIDDGSTCAQLFVGRDTLVADVYGMKSDKQFVNTLEDQIRKRGAMDKLISDRAQAEISNRVLDLLRAYCIDDWQSEPYHQHQNFAENRWNTIKSHTNLTMDRTGSPPSTWLLCLMWVTFVMNHLAHPNLDGQTPLQRLTGSTPDISIITCFHWWEPVYYAVDDDDPDGPSFPSRSKEKLGRFVGFSESVGGPLTFKILTDDTSKIIHRSTVRSALPVDERNRRLSQLEGEPSTKPIREYVKSRSGAMVTLPTINPDDIIGRTYLTPPDEDGQVFRAKVVRKIISHEEDLENHPDRVKFLVSVGEDQADAIITYNEVLQLLNDEIERDLQDGTEDGQQYWKFQEIIGHQGPLREGDRNYKGSGYNVMVAWEDGSTTYEPLHIIGADSPMEVARYAREHGLLDLPGWKRYRRLATRDKRLIRLVKQARLKSIRHAPIYQFGFQVPRSVKEAIELDKQNGNTKWQDAMALELAQLQEYSTFRDLGKGSKPPPGYKRIHVHFVFACKHDGRHKARLVANGNLTDPPLDSVYSGVVSLRSLRIVVFLAELNNLQLHQADVGNAYLEAKTQEKVYIVAGAGFGELEGHILVIYKALYGLRSSGARWHDRFSDTLRDMGFTPSKADPDVWLRKDNDIYEYMAVYVDDLVCAAKEPKIIMDTLMQKYMYKLKGVGPVEYHLGCDFGRDPDGTLWFGPRRYIKKMVESYEKLFGEKPRLYNSPLEKNDHPELDDSELLSPEDVTKFQSMIGASQWLVSLGRFDIACAVMTMSRFRIAPRKGHMERMKRIYGYISKMDHGCIRVRTEIPDYSDISIPDLDWSYSVYGNVREQIPSDTPEPLGKPVCTSHYHDANLYHDLITGRAVTGILHFLNGTPIDWYSKRQATVETATYGSEFVSARITTEQIIDLRISLRYLGVPVMDKSFMFGDNKSVVTSSTIPSSALNKRHNALSYHKVREAIASKFLVYVHISGLLNVSDVLSKHCGHQQFWPLIKPLLFWMGDVAGCVAKGEKESVSRLVD